MSTLYFFLSFTCHRCLIKITRLTCKVQLVAGEVYFGVVKIGAVSVQLGVKDVRPGDCCSNAYLTESRCHDHNVLCMRNEMLGGEEEVLREGLDEH